MTSLAMNGTQGWVALGRAHLVLVSWIRCPGSAGHMLVRRPVPLPASVIGSLTVLIL
jgi:hypothetical protein